jgi:hypothetical protein
MSRQASTVNRREEIQGLLLGSNIKSLAYLEVEKDGCWKVVDDLSESKGIDWTENRKKFQYANYSLTPDINTISFQVVNKDAKYSEGSGTIYEEIFKNDTRVRVTSGYKLSDLQLLTDNLGCADYNFYTKNLDGFLVMDSGNSLGQENAYFTNLFTPLYDSETYSDSTYGEGGYGIYVKDYVYTGLSFAKKIKVTANGTFGNVYWFESDNRNDFPTISGSWNFLGTTINGTANFSIVGTSKRYLAVAIVCDGVSWVGKSVSSVDVDCDSYAEWIYKSVFYLDSPSYSDPPAPALPMISCSGRDAWKKAIETEINLQNVSGQTIDAIIKSVADRCGIRYSASSIDNLASYGVRTLSGGLNDVKKADEIMDSLISIVNKFGSTKYEMYLSYDQGEDDNILFVKPRPSVYQADAVFDYRRYKTLGSIRKNYDKLIFRVTALNEDKPINEDQVLATQTILTAGFVTISWTGNAIYKSYEIVGAGDSILVDVTPTSFTFNFTGIVNCTVTIRGSKFTGANPAFWGEYFNHKNMLSKTGMATKIKNQLLISSAEAKLISKGYALDNGTPVYDSTGLSFSRCNLILENNDVAFVFSRNLLLDRLFFVTGVQYHWDRSEDPQDTTSFNLQDAGLRFSDIGTFRWDDTEIYDIGYVWDQDLGVLAKKDDTDYSYLIPIEAA